MTIKIKKIRQDAQIPFRATENSAGADLFALLDGDALLKGGGSFLVPTGVAVEIPPGYGGFVFPRSSLSSKHGVSLANCVGVIDADYRGEVKIPLINRGGDDYTIKNGDRIAQLVILPVARADFSETPELSDTGRGAGGFGSTGRDKKIK